MAKETIIKFTDDIDGSEATETISFAFKGTQYEIDLGERNVAAFEKAVSKFVTNAREAGAAAKADDATPARTRARRNGATRRPRKSTTSARPAGSVREWAQANGFAVGTRGRIPAAAREAYEASVG
jgi:hypothetical protein